MILQQNFMERYLKDVWWSQSMVNLHGFAKFPLIYLHSCFCWIFSVSTIYTPRKLTWIPSFLETIIFGYLSYISVGGNVFLWCFFFVPGSVGSFASGGPKIHKNPFFSCLDSEATMFQTSNLLGFCLFIGWFFLGSLDPMGGIILFSLTTRFWKGGFCFYGFHPIRFTIGHHHLVTEYVFRFFSQAASSPVASLQAVEKKKHHKLGRISNYFSNWTSHSQKTFWWTNVAIEVSTRVSDWKR